MIIPHMERLIPFEAGIAMRCHVQGECKVYHSDEGWGWISIHGEDDVWVHFSAIQMTGYRNLTAGQKVRFDLEENPRLKDQSRRAVNVRLISEEK